jgi:hypothetical protein
MSNQIVAEKQKVLAENSTAAAVKLEHGSAACPMHGKSWVKEMFGMAVCCAAPLVIVAGIAFFDLSLGVIASGAVSLVALLACPVGMYAMMRMMMKDKK